MTSCIILIWVKLGSILDSFRWKCSNFRKKWFIQFLRLYHLLNERVLGLKTPMAAVSYHVLTTWSYKIQLWKNRLTAIWFTSILYNNNMKCIKRSFTPVYEGRPIFPFCWFLRHLWYAEVRWRGLIRSMNFPIPFFFCAVIKT